MLASCPSRQGFPHVLAVDPPALAGILVYAQTVEYFRNRIRQQGGRACGRLGEHPTLAPLAAARSLQASGGLGA